MKNKTLYLKLKENSKKGCYPMHMPGHKRNHKFVGYNLPFDIDITEINGFDNLYNCDGILKSTKEKIEKLYQSKHSYILINGSTGGILAAIKSAVNYSDKIIVARNCHKSVYNAIELNNLDAVFIMPGTDKDFGVCNSIDCEQLENIINDNRDAKLLVITSPTYEGVISNVKEIVRISHHYNIPVLLDEAHGAHLPFTNLANYGGISCGADIVINSVHKTLPSLTQTSIAHFNSAFIDRNIFEKYLAVYQTSSPSYILMSSVDGCMEFLFNKSNLFKSYEQNLEELNKEFEKLVNLKVLCRGNDNIEKHDFFAFDYGKIVVSTNGTTINGTKLAELLRKKYHFEIEANFGNYIIAMATVCDTKKQLVKFAKALLEIDSTLEKNDKSLSDIDYINILPIKKLKPAEALLSDGEFVEYTLTLGRICLENVWTYPPGIPIIVAGEVIDNNLIRKFNYIINNNVDLKSNKGELPYLYVNKLTNYK
jgi:arginine/lysine/ornithine decarboxylase